MKIRQLFRDREAGDEVLGLLSLYPHVKIGDLIKRKILRNGKKTVSLNENDEHPVTVSTIILARKPWEEKRRDAADYQR